MAPVIDKLLRPHQIFYRIAHTLSTCRRGPHTDSALQKFVLDLFIAAIMFRFFSEGHKRLFVIMSTFHNVRFLYC